MRQDYQNNWDFSIAKRTPITEGVDLQFTAEFFNLFNRTRFGDPCIFNGGVICAPFGIVTAVAGSPARFNSVCVSAFNRFVRGTVRRSGGAAFFNHHDPILVVEGEPNAVHEYSPDFRGLVSFKSGATIPDNVGSGCAITRARQRWLCNPTAQWRFPRKKCRCRRF